MGESSSSTPTRGRVGRPNRFGVIRINADALVPDPDAEGRAAGVKRKISLIYGPTAPARSEGIFNEFEDDIVFTEGEEPVNAYESLSLDEIIRLNKCRAATVVVPDMGPTKAPMKEDTVVHDLIKDENEEKLSPISVLRILSENQKLVEMVAHELSVLEGADYRQHRWRVTWTHEKITGIGQGPRKLLAAQSGALDLVEKLRIKFPEYELPDCAIPRGCLISPYVFMLLEEKCTQMDYASPTFELKIRTMITGKKLFQSFCYIEDEVFVGESMDATYAKRFAGKAAYEAVLHGQHADDEIVLGEKCGEDREYSQVESEANHVYCLYNKPDRKRPRMMITFGTGQDRVVTPMVDEEAHPSENTNTTSGGHPRPIIKASVLTEALVQSNGKTVEVKKEPAASTSRQAYKNPVLAPKEEEYDMAKLMGVDFDALESTELATYAPDLFDEEYDTDVEVPRPLPSVHSEPDTWNEDSDEEY